MVDGHARGCQVCHRPSIGRRRRALRRAFVDLRLSRCARNREDCSSQP
jgi:hypothetical protein